MVNPYNLTITKCYNSFSIITIRNANFCPYPFSVRVKPDVKVMWIFEQWVTK